ncbi:unnamed protein product [Owenia fusiformis]|uniref:Uncharacterized protein n=1 Tax=Owenia fusiformis TaxID=6347 RepID=A0A8S4NL31_OWEFU|nr:unnamed protein product [Owenia fusiformis]
MTNWEKDVTVPVHHKSYILTPEAASLHSFNIVSPFKQQQPLIKTAMVYHTCQISGNLNSEPTCKTMFVNADNIKSYMNPSNHQIHTIIDSGRTMEKTLARYMEHRLQQGFRYMNY